MTGLVGADTYPLPPEFLAIVNLGAFVMFFALGLRGFVWLKPAVDELKDLVKELRAENQKLNQFARESWVPALTTANEANERTADAIKSLDTSMHGLDEDVRRLSDEIRRLGWGRPQWPTPDEPR